MKIVYKNGTGEIVEKKSRFIANVFSIKDEEEAASIIAQNKKQYWDARHNCYAYVLGDKNEIQKFSDDGEPSGTAGKPILDIIIREEVHNCLIIVTRYFGGTLLGTGGLIRAYQGSAKEGLAVSEVVDTIDGVRLSVDIDYNSIGKIQYLCSQMNIDIVETNYTENVHMEFLVNKEDYVQFAHKISEEFNGKIVLNKLKEQYFCKTDKNDVIIF